MPEDYILELERDLYRTLLDLGSGDEVEPFLAGALALVADLCSARKGYLELTDNIDGNANTVWATDRGCSPDEVKEISTMVSRGIIGATIASGRTVVTASALTDPRFRDRGSVQRNSIEAVLCVPIGADPLIGVLYLLGHIGGGQFSSDQIERVETAARYLGVLSERIIARQHSLRAVDYTRELRAKIRSEGVIGHSRAIAETLKQIALVAALDVGVLLTGQCGTGKSQLARVLHDNSPRAEYTFLELNCAALPDSLLESELFGAMPGAHSTATKRLPGKLAAADRGTLFLDEVGELSLSAQSKLLQFLQSREYFPLGATQPLVANVRIIAATNLDLLEAVREKRFREDLLYRLQVLPIRVPALVERREDISELSRFFCKRACAMHKLGQLEVSNSALRAAESADWPGNVRQLAHAIEAAAIRAAGEGVLQVGAEHLFPSSVEQSAPVVLTLQAATRQFQRRFVLETLERTDWNVSEAAESLDVARSHLYALIKTLGLKRRIGNDAPRRSRASSE